MSDFDNPIRAAAAACSGDKQPQELVSVPLEAVAQAAAALDIAGRRDLATWLMKSAGLHWRRQR